MPERVASVQEAIRFVPAGARVFVGSATGIPRGLVAALLASTTLDRLALVVGYLLAPLPLQRRGFSVTTLQPSTALWRSVPEADILDVRYSDYESLFQLGSRLELDVALVQVSRAGPDGRHSLGTSVGGVLPAIRNAQLVIAQVNRHMPYVFGDGELLEDAFDVLVDHDEPLVEFTPRPPSLADCAISERVAALIPDGVCIQLGVGSLPQRVGELLSQRSGLSVRSGMISDWAMHLDVARESPILAAEVVGSTELYRWVHLNPRVRTSGAAATHIPHSAVPFFAVNSALEVDLSGAVNAEVAHGRVLSGPGGLPDFTEIALHSPQGHSVVMLAATSPDGTQSHLVRNLAPLRPVTLPSWLADTFVTDHGVACVRHLGKSAKAQAIAAIASPRFRESLRGDQELSVSGDDTVR